MAASILDALVRPAAGCENLRPSTVSPHVSPIAALAIKGGVRGLKCSERMEPVYGGYANGRGDVVLFGKEIDVAASIGIAAVDRLHPLGAFQAPDAAFDSERRDRGHVRRNGRRPQILAPGRRSNKRV